MTEQRWGQPRKSRSRTRRVSPRAYQASDDHERAELARAHQKWQMGLVIPAHITLALDAAELSGPLVDLRCGVQEPRVDNWEAGTWYPSWEQLLKLAELTGRHPSYFMAPVKYVTSVYDTSLRFHAAREERWSPAPLPIHSFTYQAMRRARSMGVVT